MWHKANVRPSEYGFYAVWVMRQDTGYAFMHEGYWIPEIETWTDGHGHPLEHNRWTLIAWYDVPAYHSGA